MRLLLTGMLLLAFANSAAHELHADDSRVLSTIIPVVNTHSPPPVPLPHRIRILSAEQKKTQSLRKVFRELDRNESGGVELSELLVEIPPESIAEQTQRMRICDADRSGDLTFNEWRLHRAFERAKDRASIPDPMQRRANAIIKQSVDMIAAADIDQSGHLDPAEWASLAPPDGLPNWIPWQPIAGWDRNADQTVTSLEVEQRLLAIYGLRAGEANLRNGGEAFNWKKWLKWDVDQNRLLSREEFVPEFWGGPEKGAALFGRADKDEDGQLSFAEAASNAILRQDLVSDFAKWDVGVNGQAGDGLLSAEEVRQKAPKWEQRNFAFYFHAADRNHDGQLSLTEYLGSAWGLTLGDWFRAYSDEDNDLKLTWPEFLVQSIPDGAVAAEVELVMAQARWMFDALQTDDEPESLAQAELPFKVRRVEVQPAALATSLDLNDDGHVTFDEAFGLPGPDPQVPMLSWFRPLFGEVDVNHDEVLAADELIPAVALQDTVQLWRQHGRVLWNQFRDADRNMDGEVSEAELIVAQTDERPDVLRQQLTVLDFDQSAGLNFEEFLSLPRNNNERLRGRFPDPVADRIPELLEQWVKLLRPLDTNHDSQWSPDEWKYQGEYPVPEEMSAVPPRLDLGQLDINSDEAVTVDELRNGLEVLYGLRAGLKGPSLRSPVGLRFSVRNYFNGLEAGSAGLSYATAAKKGGIPGEKLHAWCERIDVNGDQVLTLPELLQGSVFWSDPLRTFLQLDTDLDAQVSLSELTHDPPDWFRRYADRLIPAFDDDGDGKLSFREFCGCPLTNPVDDWSDPVDSSIDGRLSAAEFIAGGVANEYEPLLAHGYRLWAFRQWDTNHDGELSFAERRFKTKINELPPDRLFEYFDENNDQRLSSEELTRRRTAASADPQSEEWAKAQAFAAKIEEALLSSDVDGDNMVSHTEFLNSPLLAKLTPKRPRQQIPNLVPGGVVPAEQPWLNRRLWILIGVNLLLLGVIYWLFVRR
ncbi:MAG: EF-hand domain-containing protein [Planctomycetaceae bacterium]|nr:EF-hand domain-containing protein [Planctomycetaceae bacterium]